jgi:HEAT repeat protein
MIYSGNNSVQHLIWCGLKSYSTAAVFVFLEDPNVIVRTEAARRLMHRPSRKVFLHVSKLLTSNTVYKREIAAFTLGQLGTPERPYKKESTRVLLRALKKDQSPIVRANIIVSLGHLKAEEALRRIIPFAKDRSPAVRAAVAFAIGMIYCERSKDIPQRLMRLLRKLRADRSRSVREDAALSLELVRGPLPGEAFARQR